jgi:large subunit ribosomal protein L24
MHTGKVHKKDTVLVITGKDSGKKGKVLRVITKKSAALVEGVNFIRRHTKPNPQRNVKGGIVEREAPVDMSNLMVVCPECSKAVRIGHRILEDGRKVRICRACNGVIDR